MEEEMRRVDNVVLGLPRCDKPSRMIVHFEITGWA